MRSPRLLAAAAAAATLTVLTGCAGTGDDVEATASTLRDCLVHNGVTVPDGWGVGAGGADRPTARPSGAAGARPSGFPSARPSGFPSARPSSGVPGRGSGDRVPDGVDPAAWQEAMQACSSLLPAGDPGAGRPGGGQDGGPGTGAQAAYAHCLEEHGVTVPDGAPVDEQALDGSDPAVAEALEVCAPLRP